MAAGLSCALLSQAWGATASARGGWSGSLFADGGAAAPEPSPAKGGEATRPTAITVNGRALTGPNSVAQYRGGRLFLPVAAIARALGDRIGVDAASGTVTVQRQTGVASDFSARLGQVRENGSAVLTVGGAADIVFPPDAEGLMLPVEIVSALLDASIMADEAARAVRVTRGVARAETVREGARHSRYELYQLDYEYDFNRYAAASNQSLTLRASGRAGDGRFGLLTNSVAGRGADPSLLRNALFTFERPNGQRFVAGDFGTGTDLEFISAAVRGAQFETSAGRARVTAFAGRTVSGVLSSLAPDVSLATSDVAAPSPQTLPVSGRLAYDTNVFGAYATFGPPSDGRARSNLFSFSSGALHFGGPGRGGDVATGAARFVSTRSRLQADVAFGRFKRTQREGISVEGGALAADISGSFNLTDALTLQGRYAYTGANFLNPQPGLHDPVNLAAGGFTWRAGRWLTASFNGSTATRPGTVGQRDRFLTSAFTLTPPRRGLPSVFFSHTQSSTPLAGATAFTLLNVGREFGRARLFFNATRVKAAAAANLNAQTGASIRLGESGSLQLSQSFGSRGALGGTADWQSQALFGRRVNVGAGFAYYHGGGAQQVSLSERVSATVRLPRESSLQLSYLQTHGGPTLLLSLRGSLLKKRSAERAASAEVRELSQYGTFSGRVYQDVDGDGRFDPNVDRPQAGVKVRVDGSRYVETDEAGRFRVEEVRAGDHNVYIDLLSVRADLTLLDGGQQAATLLPGRDAIVDFRLARTGRLTGVVWFDGDEDGLMDEGEQPLADVRVVTAGGRDTLTDANGAFTLGDLPPGEYAVLLDEKTLPERTKSSAGSLTVKVTAGAETGGLKFAVIDLPPEVKRFSSK